MAGMTELLQAATDWIADRWLLREDKREDFRAELLPLLRQPATGSRLIWCGEEVRGPGRKQSRELVHAARAVGIQRKYFALSTWFDSTTVFHQPVGLRIYRDRVTVRARTRHGIRWLELAPFRDPGLK
jgi:hypothetical protein